MMFMGCGEQQESALSKKKHKIRPKVDELRISREPVWTYGNMEKGIRGIRDHRPLDLNAEYWRTANPDKSFQQWQKEAQHCLNTGLHYDMGPLDLKAEIIKHEETDEIIRELIEFNTTPWFRVKGYFLAPKNVQGPLPALVVFHAWGGPMLFGKERIVNTNRDHILLQRLRDKLYDGKYLAGNLLKMAMRSSQSIIIILANVPPGVLTAYQQSWIHSLFRRQNMKR